MREYVACMLFCTWTNVRLDSYLPDPIGSGFWFLAPICPKAQGSILLGGGPGVYSPASVLHRVFTSPEPHVAGFLLIIQTLPTSPNYCSLDILLLDPLSCWDASLTWGWRSVYRAPPDYSP